jgi:hypothetical protein
MLPEPGELETFLQLESAIRRKILAASVYGMETQVLDNVESELRSYAERLTGGDTTLLDEYGDDDGTGAFAGESLRAELMRAITEGELDRLRALPWGIGAGFRQGPGVPSRGNPGVFFACRTRGGQRYWRYIEAEETLDGDAEILRRINPGAAQGEQIPATGFDLETMWRTASASVVDEHNRRADPRAAGERIGPVQRFAIDLLRDPTVLLPSGAAEAEEALSVERSSAVRQALATIRSLVSEGSISRDEAAVRITQVVESFGLRPVEPGPALEPVSEDDIGVVCWMAVLPQVSD